MRTHDYDLDPLQPLGGLSLTGTVRRRFLISYAVEPERLAGHLPPGAELSIAHDRAWVSACFVHIDDMRPTGLPAAVGMGFDYLIHRTRAWLPFPDGVVREAVLVLDPNISGRGLARLGRLTSGVRFQVRDLSHEETADGWRLQMAEEDQILFDVTIDRDFGTRLPAGSAFARAGEADAFLLGVAYGAEWQPSREWVRLLAETHAPWTTQVGIGRTHTNAFLESLGVDDPVVDHVITMTDISHHFALRGVDVRTPMSEGSIRG